MSQWYSLNGNAVYISDKAFKDARPCQIWMTICCNDQGKVLVGYDCRKEGNEVISEENRVLSLDLCSSVLGPVDLSRHIFSLKLNDELHTFKMSNANQTDCWFTQLSSMVGNSMIINQRTNVRKSRERFPSAGTTKMKQKSSFYRHLSPCPLRRESCILDAAARENHLRSATSDGIFSNYASTSVDVSDEVFNSSLPRTFYRYYSDKSLNNFSEGHENDLLFLFDNVRDKAHQHFNNVKMELLVTQIDFLENVLHHLISDDDTEYVKNRFGKKIQSILESSREQNPCLPTFNKLPNVSHFVDNFGFKHNLGNTGCLKLVCLKLLNDLKLRVQTFDVRVKHMSDTLSSHCGEVELSLESIEAYWNVGFPSILRIQVWNFIVNQHLKKIKFPMKQTKTYYAMLLQQVHNVDADVKQTIRVESFKIYTQNVFFDQIDSIKIRDVQNVMMAIYVRNVICTYCPLLMKISAMAILILDPVEVFRLIVAVSESIVGPNDIHQSLSTSLAEEIFLKKLIRDKFVDLHEHFLATGTDITFLTKRWISNVFTDCFPFESSLRILDMFLLKGYEWVVLLCAVIINLERKKIKLLGTACEIYRHLNTRYNQLYDIDYLLEETKKFEISFSTGYITRTRSRIHEMSVSHKNGCRHGKEHSNQTSFQDNCAAFQHIDGKIECTCFNDEYIFISVARQTVSVVYVLNFRRGFVKDKSLKLSMLVSVMECTKSFLVVASDLGVVACCDFIDKDWIWKVTLDYCPLNMAFVHNAGTVQLFIALDNGAITIKEDLISKSTDSIFYLQISLSPIYKMIYSHPYLVCVSGDHILVIDPSNIIIISKIILTSDIHLIIQDIKLEKTYIWLVFKGSTIIQLWNIETCSQILSQNVAISQGRRVVNGSITLIHPIVGQHQLWIATDTGEMFIYDVKCTMSREWPLHNSDLQLNHANNSWECHQAVVDKVTDYLSSISLGNPHYDFETGANHNSSRDMEPRTARFQKRVSVAVIDDDFVDISIMGERGLLENRKSYGSLDDRPMEEDANQFCQRQNAVSYSPLQTSDLSNEEVHLKQKIFLSLKGGMKISDSPILYVCSLTIPNEIEEAFMTISSYMEEEDNIVIWKQGAQGWKYKVMHYECLDKSKNFFSRLFQRLQLPLI